MELIEYIEKIIEKDLQNGQLIMINKIKNTLYSQHNLDPTLDEIASILKADTRLLEIGNNFFMEKVQLHELLKNIPLEDLKEELENEYFVALEGFEAEKIISAIGEEGIVKSNPLEKLEKKLELINEGLYGLEKYIKTEKFWLELLKKKIGSEKKNFKELMQDLLFYRGVEFKERIIQTLKNKCEFKVVNFQEQYALKNNPAYATFKNNLNYELENFLSEFRSTYIEVFHHKIIEGKTLEETGKIIGCTRERVRQIEVKLLEKMKKNTFQLKMKPYQEYIDLFFNNHESTYSKERFMSYLNNTTAFSEFKYDLIKIYNLISDEKIYEPLNAYISKKSESDLRKVFEEIFKETKTLTKDLLMESLEDYGISDWSFVRSYLKNSSNVENYKELYLYKEGRVNLIDKLELILRYEDRELKISEIREKYNEYYNENSNDHSIGARLQSTEDVFTRTFVGTYALKEWGMQVHIDVKDLVVDYLKEKKRPCTYMEIVKAISSKTRANETTIRMFISGNKATFAYSHGEWALIEWAKDKELAEKYKISENRIEASRETVVQDNYKGTFKKNGRFINLYHIGRKAMEGTGVINLGQALINIMNEKALVIHSGSQSYNLSLSSDKSIYGIKKILEARNLAIGEYFYLEYFGNGVMKLHTWDEFEKGYSSIIEERDPAKETRKEPWTFEKVLRFGLDNAYIESEWLSEIDYEIEEVTDHYEARERLEEVGIIIKD